MSHCHDQNGCGQRRYEDTKAPQGTIEADQSNACWLRLLAGKRTRRRGRTAKLYRTAAIAAYFHQGVNDEFPNLGFLMSAQGRVDLVDDVRCRSRSCVPDSGEIIGGWVVSRPRLSHLSYAELFDPECGICSLSKDCRYHTSPGRKLAAEYMYIHLFIHDWETALTTLTLCTPKFNE